MAMPSKGTKLYIRDTSGVDHKFAGLQSITPPDGQRNEIDQTTLEDDAEVVGLGIKRFGSLSASLLYIADDTAFDEAETAYEAAETRTFTWVFPNGNARQFTAYVMSIPFQDVEVDTDYKSNITLRVTGDITKLDTFTPAE